MNYDEKQTSTGMTLIGAQDYRDSLKNTIESLVRIMKSDYGQLYAAQFKTSEDLTEWKRRAWAKLKGLDCRDIVNGYEILTTENKKILPTVLDIAESAIKAGKDRQREAKTQREAIRIAELLPAKEIHPSVANDNLKKIHGFIEVSLAKTGKQESESERRERLLMLDKKIEVHDELLKKDFVGMGRAYLSPNHECGVGFCRYPGVMSSSTTGGNFYCKEHFRR